VKLAALARSAPVSWAQASVGFMAQLANLPAEV
jgi:hypothetical protein